MDKADQFVLLCLLRNFTVTLLVFANQGKETRQVNLRIPASKKKLFAVSALLLLFMLGLSSTAYAADSLYNPSQTPQTTFDPIKFFSPIQQLQLRYLQR